MTNVVTSDQPDLYARIIKSWTESKFPSRFDYAGTYYLALRGDNTIKFIAIDRPDQAATSFKR